MEDKRIEDAREIATDEVSRRIHEERIKRGWTIYKLASLSGVHTSNISRIEDGFICPRVDLLHKLCVTLEIEIKIPF